MTVVGALGLGAMGGPIARHVRRAGFDVRCLDNDPEATRPLAALGATVCGSLAELGTGTDICLVTLPGDDDVLKACLPGEGGLLACLEPSSVLVICSSVRPETCRALAEAADGVDVLDAALTGGVRGAEAGRISLLVGGGEAALGRARPVFGAFCSAVHHLGGIGSGQVGKTVNNLIHWAQIVAIAEALSLGARLGVPPDLMRPALTAGPTDSRTLRELELMRLTWYAKDIDNAQRMARATGMPLPLTGEVRRLMDHVTVPGIAALLQEGHPIDLPSHE
jgi:3-hydroxyisobutyrate dehydrogenase-like beta-hydroxyacid dehydrogenase